jgi:hypothetical protein
MFLKYVKYTSHNIILSIVVNYLKLYRIECSELSQMNVRECRSKHNTYRAFSETDLPRKIHHTLPQFQLVFSGLHIPAGIPHLLLYLFKIWIWLLGLILILILILILLKLQFLLQCKSLVFSYVIHLCYATPSHIFYTYCMVCKTKTRSRSRPLHTI